jgi:carboxylate/amino acid/amine transporter
MGYLIIVALIQAFSFNLIGEYLAGHVDSYFAVLARVLLAGLVFLPLTRWRQVEPRFMRSMLLIGALQYGITYVCLYLSFRVLTVPEVLLFTILTPLHVTLIEDALNRRFNPWALVAALVAVAGAAVIRFDRISGEFFMGFLLLQLANFTYAAGQVLYRIWWRHPSDLPHYGVSAISTSAPAGGAAGLPAVRQRPAPAEHRHPVAGAVVPGLCPTALGLYWWNKGACLVSGGTLAVMNNLHVPVGLLLNLLIWNQHEPLGRLFIGGSIILASVWMSRLGGRALCSRWPAGFRRPLIGLQAARQSQASLISSGDAASALPPCARPTTRMSLPLGC